MAESVRPVVSVSVIVFRDRAAQEVLVVERGREPLKGYWAPPGGRIEAGETIAEAVRREVREECGIEITLPDAQTINAYDGIAHDPDGNLLYHFVLICVVAVAAPGAEPIAGDDAAACRWVPLAEVATLDPQVEELTNAVALGQARLTSA